MRIAFSMSRLIGEVKRHPAFYAAALFPVLTAFFAGGMAGLRLMDSAREGILRGMFHGETYWQIVFAVLWKRLAFLSIQALFSLWMAGLPISLAAGMCLQVSWSLVWFCRIRNVGQGILLMILLMPESIAQIMAGAYCMSVNLRYFAKLYREISMPKSAAEILREGSVPAGKILFVAIVYAACILPEVFIYLNIS